MTRHRNKSTNKHQDKRNKRATRDLTSLILIFEDFDDLEDNLLEALLLK